MTNESNRHVALMFADLAGSSRLYSKLGDAAATGLIHKLLDVLEKEVVSSGGIVLDRIGDELFCMFDDEKAAVLNAVDLQAKTRSFTEHDAPARGLALRIGLHAAPCQLHEGRPVGKAVSQVKHLAATAKAGQILVVEEWLERLDKPSITSRFVEARTLKGQTTTTRIHEVLGSDVDVTFQRPGRADEHRKAGFLKLSAGPQTARLALGEKIVLGRAHPADLILDSSTVSRLHATIEARKGGFVLTDLSTNGTYLSRSIGADTRQIHREEIILPESGYIGLGEAPAIDSKHTVRFRQVTEVKLQ